MLTFPIDTKDVHDIPEFAQILDEFGGTAPDIEGMLRYLCYRFDPKCAEVRRAIGIEEKGRIAQVKANWTVPEPRIEVQEDGTMVMDALWLAYSKVQGAFFEVLDNDEWEFIVSLDIAIHNAHMVIRQPIPPDGDAETNGKILLNIQKAIKGNEEALAIRRAAAMRLADSDPDAAKNLLAATKAQRRSVSPEGHLRGGK
jgi:hypothetical protein